jgi:hypothetical protein
MVVGRFHEDEVPILVFYIIVYMYAYSVLNKEDNVSLGGGCNAMFSPMIVIMLRLHNVVMKLVIMCD